MKRMKSKIWLLLIPCMAVTSLEGMEPNKIGITLTSEETPSLYSPIAEEENTHTTSSLKRRAEEDNGTLYPAKRKSFDDYLNMHNDFSKRREAAREFLNFNNCDEIKEVGRVIEEYREQILQGLPNGFRFNLDNFSGYARIYLLTEVLNINIRTLPEYFSWKGFNELSNHIENDLWKIEQGEPENKQDIELVWKFINARNPIYFEVGGFEYEFRHRVSRKQPGNGELYGLIDENRGEKYDNIIEVLEGYLPGKREKFVEYLTNQKKDGKPISINHEYLERFLNGFNLLLDYEVARRLVPSEGPYEKDFCGDLPVLTYIENIIKSIGYEDLTVLKIFLLGKLPSEWQSEWQAEDMGFPSLFTTEELKCKDKQSLLQGDFREKIAPYLPVFLSKRFKSIEHSIEQKDLELFWGAVKILEEIR
jgi:hypothetical protein